MEPTAKTHQNVIYPPKKTASALESENRRRKQELVWAGFLGPFDVRHVVMGRMARKVLS